MNILIIVSTFVFIILLWGAVGLRYLRHLRADIKAGFEGLSDALRKRQDYVPLLIEIARRHSNNDFKELINVRAKAMRTTGGDATLIENEHYLSTEINKITDLSKELENLRHDAQFQEIKTDIETMENEIEQKLGEYNEKVRANNKGVSNVFLTLLARFFGFRKANIFEFEI